MGPADAPNFGEVVGAAVFASALGWLAFFVPEGLGVSDSLLIVLLTQATGLPATTCITAAVAVRTLDPLTKLSLLGMSAVIAPPAAAQRIGHWFPDKPVMIPST